MPFTEWLPRIVAGQMAAIERTLNVLGPANSAEAERTARILATIARTVQEIKATAEGRVSNDETDNDSVPRDMDVFRELLRGEFDRLSTMSSEEQARITARLLKATPDKDRNDFVADFSTFAHAHQFPPRARQQRRGLDHLADAGRARRRQDARRRRMGARAGAQRPARRASR